MSSIYTDKVRVVTALEDDRELFDEFDDIRTFEVTGEHLKLYDTTNRIVAAYAPKDWMRVKRVTDAS